MTGYHRSKQMRGMVWRQKHELRSKQAQSQESVEPPGHPRENSSSPRHEILLILCVWVGVCVCPLSVCLSVRLRACYNAGASKFANEEGSPRVLPREGGATVPPAWLHNSPPAQCPSESPTKDTGNTRLDTPPPRTSAHPNRSGLGYSSCDRPDKRTTVFTSATEPMY